VSPETAGGIQRFYTAADFFADLALALEMDVTSNEADPHKPEQSRRIRWTFRVELLL
jgi:hypothetical protein